MRKPSKIMSMHSWRNWIAHQIPILAVTGSIPVECAKGQVGKACLFIYKILIDLCGVLE